jgi:phage tail-like protein
MADDQRPYTNNKFRVEIEGQELKYVKRVTGLDSKTDVKELRTGNKPVEYRPGKTTYADISIERFIVDKDQTLKKWWDEYKEGKTKVTRKSGSVIILTDDYSDGLRLNFEGALPKDYNSGNRSAMQDDYPTEHLVLQIEKLSKA